MLTVMLVLGLGGVGFAVEIAHIRGADTGGGLALPAPLEAAYENVPEGYDQRARTIRRWLADHTDHGWAGSYYRGDGTGANVSLSLAPELGATASWEGCLGLYAVNHGKVLEHADGGLRIAFAADNEPEGVGFPEHLMPVRWGDRRYLLSPDQLHAFVSAVHRGFEPRPGLHGPFLMRMGDEARPVSGVPEQATGIALPIRRAPIELRLQTVEEIGRSESYGLCLRRLRMHATLQGAAEPPLQEGEILYSPTDFDSAEVTAVGPEVIEIEGRDYDCKPSGSPRPGDVFSTGALLDK